MEQQSLSSIDGGPDDNEKRVPANVVRSTHLRLCLGLMPFFHVIIGRVGIQYPGS